jgi:DNA polymerase elongation subunit (family B)
MNNEEDINFQILDWGEYHEQDFIENLQGKQINISKYTIRLFGRIDDRRTIYVRVDNFCPYFYVLLHDKATFNDISRIKTELDRKLKDVKRFDWEKKIKTKDRKYNDAKIKTIMLGVKSYEIVKQHKFKGFSNYKLYKFMKISFYNYYSFKAYETVIKEFEIDYRTDLPKELRKPVKLKLFESNITPFIRCMHIQNLDAIGWVKISARNYVNIDGVSYDDISIATDYRNLQRVNNIDISRFKIASFDIECISEDGSFPQPDRAEDKIIQIGTTFSRYGSPDCYMKHIVTLDACAHIRGAIVISCDTEKQLLLEWKKLILEENPDIITGYNINGFDFTYLKERAKLLGIEEQFSVLSKLKNYRCQWQEKALSSSALGDNLLKFYEMPGRVIIDLMKVAQRDYKLDSYKLDSVVATFIREDIITFYNEKNTTIIKTPKASGIIAGQYITIYYNDGLTDNKLMDGEKFKITKIETIQENNKKLDLIIVSGKVDIEILNNKGFKFYWCQSKDDISPQMIFKYQKQSSLERAIIAKYCLQDCELCNKLIDKLQVIPNNVGMGNVCNVPLSYLFMRGQGIKIYSFVAKICREENHLIPLNEKKTKTEKQETKEEIKEDIDLEDDLEANKIVERLNSKDVDGYESDEDEDQEDNDEGYEGATVFPPVVGVHYEPVAVLDYASLYPNSMILRNKSHETLVLKEKYMNLEDYRYHKCMYKNNDKSWTTCYFAEKKDGSKGIIPRILINLLKKRKEVREEIKKTDDKFKIANLDGLQLAYKVVANTVYGQTGARTSSIYCKQIAASTTATGRDFLRFSKYFIMNNLKRIVNYAIEDKDKYIEYMNEKYLYYPHKVTTIEGDEIIVNTDENTIIPDNKFSMIDGPKVTKEEFIEHIYNFINSNITNNIRIRPEVIYGDTDSVFFKPKLYDTKIEDYLNDYNALCMSIKVGMLASKLICTMLPPPMAQEYEKVLYPFIILSKKRYVGNLYSDNPDKFKQKSMGIVLKRRDNAAIVKYVCGGIIDQMLNKRSSEGAINFTKQAIKDILCNKFTIDKFVITKTLKSNYKDRTRIAHATLADRMGIRDPGNKPEINERIPFAYIQVKENKFKKILQGDKIEHIDYIIKNKLKLDYIHYITNQIMKPAIQFLEIITDKPNKIFEDLLNREKLRRNGVRPIMYYYENSENTDLDNLEEKSEDLIDQEINFDDEILLKLEEKQNKKKKKKV